MSPISISPFVLRVLRERGPTHLVVSRALGLRDELGITDVTVALCEQASVHHILRLHLHLRLYRNSNVIKRQE